MGLKDKKLAKLEEMKRMQEELARLQAALEGESDSDEETVVGGTTGQGVADSTGPGESHGANKGQSSSEKEPEGDTIAYEREKESEGEKPEKEQVNEQNSEKKDEQVDVSKESETVGAEEALCENTEELVQGEGTEVNKEVEENKEVNVAMEDEDMVNKDKSVGDDEEGQDNAPYRGNIEKNEEGVDNTEENVAEGENLQENVPVSDDVQETEEVEEQEETENQQGDQMVVGHNEEQQAEDGNENKEGEQFTENDQEFVTEEKEHSDPILAKDIGESVEKQTEEAKQGANEEEDIEMMAMGVFSRNEDAEKDEEDDQVENEEDKQDDNEEKDNDEDEEYVYGKDEIQKAEDHPDMVDLDKEPPCVPLEKKRHRRKCTQKPVRYVPERAAKKKAKKEDESDKENDSEQLRKSTRTLCFERGFVILQRRKILDWLHLSSRLLTCRIGVSLQPIVIVLYLPS